MEEFVFRLSGAYGFHSPPNRVDYESYFHMSRKITKQSLTVYICPSSSPLISKCWMWRMMNECRIYARLSLSLEVNINIFGLVSTLALHVYFLQEFSLFCHHWLGAARCQRLPQPSNPGIAVPSELPCHLLWRAHTFISHYQMFSFGN